MKKIEKNTKQKENTYSDHPHNRFLGLSSRCAISDVFILCVCEGQGICACVYAGLLTCVDMWRSELTLTVFYRFQPFKCLFIL